MQSEFKHKERTTKRNKLIEGDPIAQFKEKMNAILLSEGELERIINIEYLENCIDNIHYSNPEKSIYLNPIAFILGFYILKNKKINRDKFKSLDNFKILMDENFISSIDVLRYARYWIINNEFKEYVFKEDDENVFKEDDENKFKEDDENDVEDKKMITENNLYADEYSGEEYGNEEYEEGFDDEPESLKKFK